ncbi:helix-turn-helix transcriptional regulator [Ensifer sp. IC3342]|nr:helix-turn-helix transcriptional regulator [Ensifer sp. IC3342]
MYCRRPSEGCFRRKPVAGNRKDRPVDDIPWRFDRQQCLNRGFSVGCGPGESGASAIVATRVEAALDQTGASLQEPALSVEIVARRLNISPRYLQRLLEMSGMSFTQSVNELRLRKALALLTEVGDGPRRISDIALQAGFSDISHFNRLFRSRFGDTPSAVGGLRPRTGEGA